MGFTIAKRSRPVSPSLLEVLGAAPEVSVFAAVDLPVEISCVKIRQQIEMAPAGCKRSSRHATSPAGNRQCTQLAAFIQMGGFHCECDAALSRINGDNRFLSMSLIVVGLVCRISMLQNILRWVVH